MTWPEVYPATRHEVAGGKLPWKYECSECTWLTYHTNEASGHNEARRHRLNTCPYDEGNGHGEDGFILTLHDNLWQELDKATAKVMSGKPEGYMKDGMESTCDPNEARSYDEARGNARGLAIAIFHMGTPFWEDANKVAVHAVKRYKAQLAGEEMPQTLGLNGFNPHLQDEADKVRNKAPAKKAAPAKAAAPAPASGSLGLDDGQVETIKAALASGLPVKSIAGVYKVTEAQIIALRDAS